MRLLAAALAALSLLFPVALLSASGLRWLPVLALPLGLWLVDVATPLPLLHTVSLVDPVLGISREVPTAFQPLPTQPNINSTVDVSYRYAVAAVNARLLDKKLVLLGAARFDGYTNDFRYNSAFGDYPANWDGNAVPGKGDLAVINQPGSVTVTKSSGDSSVAGINCHRPRAPTRERASKLYPLSR